MLASHAGLKVIGMDVILAVVYSLDVWCFNKHRVSETM